jgi:hypothetical protein
MGVKIGIPGSPVRRQVPCSGKGQIMGKCVCVVGYRREVRTVVLTSHVPLQWGSA